MHRTAALVVVTALAATPTQAALVSRLGGQAVYDTDLDITWLTNADLALTQGFGINPNLINLDGSMLWSTANDWIAAMNAANYLGYHDWRLPATAQPEPACSIQGGGGGYGYHCTSEMAHLWYAELGGQQGFTLAQQHNANYDLFTNIETANNGWYWSGEYAYYTPYGWVFYFNSGYQDAKSKVNFGWVVPVRSGDTDSDGDGIVDHLDDCTLVPNPAQLDANGDGYGNACDADLDNNGTVTATDFALLRSVLGQSSGASSLAAAADLDGNGTVTATDFALLRRALGQPPGPSGLHPNCPPTCP